MSRMLQLVEELRERLNNISDTEQRLVASLREALNRFDQKLLQDVRNISAEHESRRSAILGELQGLASRMGAFPPPRDTRPGLAATSETEAAPTLPTHGRLRAVEGGGAWREATDKLQNELDTYFRKRA
jgi:hypothetical protein